jgi:hypothetical protein
VGGNGGGGGRGDKWTKPCMHIWIIKETWEKKKRMKALWSMDTWTVPLTVLLEFCFGAGYNTSDVALF